MPFCDNFVIMKWNVKTMEWRTVIFFPLPSQMMKYIRLRDIMAQVLGRVNSSVDRPQSQASL